MLPKSVQELIDQFSKLPGIGPKTAARLTFYLLSQGDEDIKALGKAVYYLKKNLVICSKCFNISETDPCVICKDPKRDKKTILVVESPLDILALEKTNEFSGLYHVVGGAISPVDDIGPEDLRIKELLDRIEKNTDNISEVILATNPNLEGEATAMFIHQQISKFKIKNIKITRIARGLPVGGDLEYADEVTLSRALEGRKEY
ncbi:MAG: recombination mediator RecR [Candidatus Berkelbacteria bacterium]|nr:recombination mediator RecR [Candidatus Berkelbacteria bacterium]